jgi:hypothetical protein
MQIDKMLEGLENIREGLPRGCPSRNYMDAAIQHIRITDINEHRLNTSEVGGPGYDKGCPENEDASPEVQTTHPLPDSLRRMMITSFEDWLDGKA